MHKRGAPTTIDSMLLAPIAHTVDLIAVGMAGVIGDVKFTVVMLTRIETRAAKTAQKNGFAGIDKIGHPTCGALATVYAPAWMFVGFSFFSVGKTFA